MVWQDIMGILGGALMTGAMIPQVYRLFKLKSAREISFVFTLLFFVGTACWLTYGILFGLPPVIFWNAVSLVLAAGMLFAKVKYGR